MPPQPNHAHMAGGAGMPAGGTATVDQPTRVKFYEVAVRQLPPRIPVSTILMPLDGDPAAAALYWELANASKGALVSPSKTWPET